MNTIVAGPGPTVTAITVTEYLLKGRRLYKEIEVVSDTRQKVIPVSSSVMLMM